MLDNYKHDEPVQLIYDKKTDRHVQIGIRKPQDGVEIRAYIHWNGLWRHVYAISGFDQIQLLGEPVKMLEFKLSKKSTQTFSAEKIKFHKNKPKQYTSRGGPGA